MVWTNDHVIQWVDSIGLGSYAPNLKETGVHGGVMALDNDFNHEKLAMTLQIQQTDIEVCTSLLSLPPSLQLIRALSSNSIVLKNLVVFASGTKAVENRIYKLIERRNKKKQH